MPLYERVDERGRIVERVRTVANSQEDNRLGVAVMEGRNGWRDAGKAGAAERDVPTSAGEQTSSESTAAASNSTAGGKTNAGKASKGD